MACDIVYPVKPGKAAGVTIQDIQAGQRIMHLNDLLQLDGPPFIEAAYLALLKRQADPSGMSHFMKRLALGDGKEAIIYALATSPEATGSRIDVIGLKQLVKRCRKPPWRQFIQDLFDVRATRRRIARIEHMVAVQHQELLLEITRLREARAYSSKSGMAGDAVKTTLRKLQKKLENTAHDPEVMVRKLENVIRSSELAQMLGKLN